MLVQISRERYYELLNAERILNALERCGVDNWSGWDDAMEIYNSEIEE